MDALQIREHSLKGWSGFTEQVGFVPDPMILRTGEVFLNGSSGTNRLERSDFDVWNALHENMGGLLDFFDMLVTRSTIPLINYGDTFDRMTIVAPLEQLLPGRIRPVEVEYSVYNEIKKGALANLAKLDLADLAGFASIQPEMNAFRYEWKPNLSVADFDPALEPARIKFAAIDDHARIAAQFLLGGFIFSGFAQASGTTHYVQPKRARFFLGLTAARDQAGTYSNREEDAIFATAEAGLKNSDAKTRKVEPVPPVLPYLLANREPKSVRELLDLALEFPNTADGKKYLGVVNAIRADGIEARRAEETVSLARQEALAFLKPYSNLDADRSRGLNVDLSVKTAGIPFVEGAAKTTVTLTVPTWLRLWWNDRVPFGGVHKTFRRMWMAADSYNDLSDKLRRVWANS